MQYNRANVARLIDPQTQQEVIARQLIDNQLTKAAAGIGVGAAAGLTGLAINGMQGEPINYYDNSFIDTVGNSVGAGLIGAGVGAAVGAPGRMKIASRQAVLNDKLANVSQAHRVRYNNVLDDARHVANSALARRMGTYAGLSAAGVGLLNLIGQLRNESSEDEYSTIKGIGGAALLGGAGLAAYNMFDYPEETVPMSDYLDDAGRVVFDVDDLTPKEQAYLNDPNRTEEQKRVFLKAKRNRRR